MEIVVSNSIQIIIQVSGEFKGRKIFEIRKHSLGNYPLVYLNGHGLRDVENVGNVTFFPDCILAPSVDAIEKAVQHLAIGVTCKAINN